MAKNNSDFFDKKKIWSEVKDRLLKCYLRPYFQKILMTRKPVLYIDCFAGKGKFADGNDGSPLIALKTREESLQASFVNSNLKKIDMCFIDLKYGSELQKNTDPYKKDGAIQIVSGKYEEKISSQKHHNSGGHCVCALSAHLLLVRSIQGPGTVPKGSSAPNHWMHHCLCY